MRHAALPSRRVRLARLIAEPSVSGKDGISFAELLAKYQSAFPDDAATHDSLTSAVGALLRDGALVRAGKRGRRTLYAVGRARANRGKRSVRRSKLAAATVATVESHYRSEGCPISTGEIRSALKEQGLWPDRYAGLPAMLRALLSAPGRGRSFERVTRPALKLAPTRTVTGRTVAFWIPVWAPDQCALRPPDRGEALRRAVDLAGAEVGRPVSKRELEWWLDTQPAGSILRAALAGAGLGPTIKNTVDRDRPHPSPSGRLHRVAGPLTISGGRPPRYTVGPPTPNDRAACTFEDAVDVVRPARELATLGALEALGHGYTGETLGHVAADRRMLALHALGAYANLRATTEVSEALQAMRSRCAVLSRWVEEAPLSYSARYARREQLARVHDDLVALEQLIIASRRRRLHAAPAGTLRFAGGAALIATRPIREFTARAIASGEIPAARPNFVYAAARRFRNPNPTRKKAAEERSCLDRVDALVEAFRQSCAQRAWRYVSLASTILGPVLRDAEYVRRRLTEVDEADRSLRPVLLVALGLLGGLPEVDDAAGDCRSVPNARAFVLASALTDLDPGSLEGRLDAAGNSFRGPARVVVNHALRRLERGAFMTLLEST